MLIPERAFWFLRELQCAMIFARRSILTLVHARERLSIARLTTPKAGDAQLRQVVTFYTPKHTSAIQRVGRSLIPARGLTKVCLSDRVQATSHFGWLFFSTGMKNIFFSIACYFLLITGFIKLIDLGSYAGILNETDPVTGLQYGTLGPLVGLLEVVIAVYLRHGKNCKCRAATLLWLMACFALYRFGYQTTGLKKPCPCLGSFGDWLPMSTDAKNQILIGSLVLLAIGSIWILASRPEENQAMEQAPIVE